MSSSEPLLWQNQVICRTNPWGLETATDLTTIFNENLATQFIQDMVHKDAPIRKAACEAVSNLLKMPKPNTISKIFHNLQQLLTNTLFAALRNNDPTTTENCLSITHSITSIWDSWNLNIVNEKSYDTLLSVIWQAHEQLKTFSHGLNIIGNICNDAKTSKLKFIFQKEAVDMLDKFHHYLVERYKQYKGATVFDINSISPHFADDASDNIQIITLAKQCAWLLKKFISTNKPYKNNINTHELAIKTLRLLTCFCFIPSVTIYEEMASAFGCHHIIKLLGINCARKMVQRIMVPIRYGWPIIFRIPILQILAQFLQELKEKVYVYRMIGPNVVWDIIKVSPCKTLEISNTRTDAYCIITSTIYFGMKMFRAHGFLAACVISYCKAAAYLDIDEISRRAVLALCKMTMNGTEEHRQKLLQKRIIAVIAEGYGKYDEEIDCLIDDSIFYLMFGPVEMEQG